MCAPFSASLTLTSTFSNLLLSCFVPVGYCTLILFTLKSSSCSQNVLVKLSWSVLLVLLEFGIMFSKITPTVGTAAILSAGSPETILDLVLNYHVISFRIELILRKDILFNSWLFLGSSCLEHLFVIFSFDFKFFLFMFIGYIFWLYKVMYKTE